MRLFLFILCLGSASYAENTHQAIHAETQESHDSAGAPADHPELFEHFYKNHDAPKEHIDRIHQLAEEGHPTAQAIAIELLMKDNGSDSKIDQYLHNALDAKEPYAHYLIGKAYLENYKAHLTNSPEHADAITHQLLPEIHQHLEIAATGNVDKAHSLLKEPEFWIRED